MSSLLALLPLFDSGSGTFYDLRHLTMKTEPKVGGKRSSWYLILFDPALEGFKDV